MKAYKRNNLTHVFYDKYFMLPALTALLTAISRYPIKLNFLVFIAFIPLLFLIQNKKHTTKKILKAALSFSTTYTIVALHWIGVVTILGLIGLFIFYAFYFFILFYIIFKVNMMLPRLTPLTLITCWISFEWLQNFGELRFPWLNIGYALAEYLYLIQIAEIGGIFLLSTVVLIINYLLFFFIKSFPGRSSFICLSSVILIFVVWTVSGNIRYKYLPLEERDFTASIVQVSIPQYQKWSEEFYETTLALYENYSMIAAVTNPDLIIWPEAAIPEYVLQSNKDRVFVETTVQKTGIDIFLGLPHYEVIDDDNGRKLLFYNAATVFHKDGTIAEPYYKNILVPVGERMPFMDYIPFLRTLNFGQANWDYGNQVMYYELEKENNVYRYSPLICYEIAFPHFTASMSEQPLDFFVNVTNDAWFERTIGPYQHGMMTVIRAVETRTQFYRAANTGISMIVSPRGEILQRTVLFEQTVIEDKLYLYNEKTLFVEWIKYYPIALLIIFGILVISAIISQFSIKL